MKGNFGVLVLFRLFVILVLFRLFVILVLFRLFGVLVLFRLFVEVHGIVAWMALPVECNRLCHCDVPVTAGS